MSFLRFSVFMRSAVSSFPGWDGPACFTSLEDVFVICFACGMYQGVWCTLLSPWIAEMFHLVIQDTPADRYHTPTRTSPFVTLLPVISSPGRYLDLDICVTVSIVIYINYLCTSRE